MLGSFTSISIFAYDLDSRGLPVRVWETVVDATEGEAIKEAKALSKSHAGALVVRRDGKPAVGEEGDPIIVFQVCKIGDFN
ncbi:hypothetical protein J5277_29685 [Rhizobium sp. 16-449-1b]|uniref:hypothetical protein n=1 Tax=Rhizobium sp. 16-449-1b TaxID=2819989 RepID=UPI001ADC80E0|nr:hypothetical protein [Rhizobium sp. 16-449-1b]MBO9198303.1 hypothetical protein [Rhizobium sp. 16-449-1b]